MTARTWKGLQPSQHATQNGNSWRCEKNTSGSQETLCSRRLLSPRVHVLGKPVGDKSNDFHHRPLLRACCGVLVRYKGATRNTTLACRAAKERLSRATCSALARQQTRTCPSNLLCRSSLLIHPQATTRRQRTSRTARNHTHHQQTKQGRCNSTRLLRDVLCALTKMEF